MNGTYADIKNIPKLYGDGWELLSKDEQECFYRRVTSIWIVNSMLKGRVK